jgi:hypothetical protein
VRWGYLTFKLHQESSPTVKDKASLTSVDAAIFNLCNLREGLFLLWKFKPAKTGKCKGNMVFYFPDWDTGEDNSNRSIVGMQRNGHCGFFHKIRSPEHRQRYNFSTNPKKKHKFAGNAG